MIFTTDISYHWLLFLYIYGYMLRRSLDETTNTKKLCWKPKQPIWWPELNMINKLTEIENSFWILNLISLNMSYL